MHGGKRRVLLASIAVITVIAAGLILVIMDNGQEAGGVDGGVPGSGQSGVEGEVLPGVDAAPRRVLIYDSLYREYPNDDLLEFLVRLFEENGFEVDVYRGINATLDPLVAIQEYGIVILRAHGAYNGDPESGKPLGAYVYTGLYVYEAQALYGDYVNDGLREGYFAKARIMASGEGSPLYLAVSPLFFDDQLGKLNNTIVFFTGCFGADDDRLAKVFLSHGAQVYLGWRGNVTWTHADTFLASWAERLAETGDPLEAYQYAMQKAGADPYTGAQVVFFDNGGGNG